LQQTWKQPGGTEWGSEKGTRLPSPKIEEETEQYDVDAQETSSHFKHPMEQEKGGSRKKSKATKTSLDPITLTEGEFHDIGDTMRGVITEVLQ